MELLHTRDEIKTIVSDFEFEQELNKLYHKYGEEALLPIIKSLTAKYLKEKLKYEKFVGMKLVLPPRYGQPGAKYGTIKSIESIHQYDVVVRFDFDSGGFDRILLTKLIQL